MVLSTIPEKYRESERLRREEEIIYQQNPDIQYASRVSGNGCYDCSGNGYDYGIRQRFPDTQNVNYLSKQPHINYYKPLKLSNPYKGNGIGTSALLFEGLDKSGAFTASKNVLNSLTKKFDNYLDNPSATREKRIITRIIPDLSYRYDVLKNDLEIYGKSWKQFRINNHKKEMLNIQSKIKALIQELTGIQSFK